MALYQTNKKFAGKGQIRYYGEVLRMESVLRRNITEVPMTRNNGDELYYKLYVRDWQDITEINETGKPITPKESGFVVDFTNMFLLEHSEYVKELLLKSEEEYRLYSELKRNISNTDIDAENQSVVFSADGCRFVFDNGDILVLKDDTIVKRVDVRDFAKKPAQTFRILKYSANMK